MRHRWNMNNEEFLAYGDKRGYLGLSPSKLAHKDNGYYQELVARKLVDKITTRECRDWRSKTDEEMLKYGEKNGLVGLTRNQIKHKDVGYYNALRNRNLLDKIAIKAHRDWESQTNEEVKKYGKVHGYIGLSIIELQKKDHGYYDILSKRNLIDEVLERKEPNFSKFTDKQLIEYGNKKGYVGMRYYDLRKKRIVYFKELESRGLLDKIVKRERIRKPIEEKLEIIKEYLSTEKSTMALGKKYNFNQSNIYNWLNDDNIIKSAINDEVFNLDYLMSKGFIDYKAEHFLNRLIEKGKAFKIGSNYTLDKELAVSYRIEKKKRHGSTSHFNPTTIRELPLDAKAELTKTISRGHSHSPREDQKGEANKQIMGEILGILNAANIQPENAFQYEQELLDGNKTVERYIDVYEKHLFPLTLNLMKAALRVNDGERVLDLGSGVNGSVLSAIEMKGKKIDYTGVDVVEEIQQRNRSKHNGRFLTLRAPYEMGKIDGEFDLITASLFFDSLNPSETAATLLQSHNLLKENGRMMITLSESRENDARIVLATLKGMGYSVESEPEAYRQTLRITKDDVKDARPFYVIETRKKGRNMEQLADYYLAMSYLQSGKIKEAKEFLQKSTFDQSLIGLAKENLRLSDGKQTFYIVDMERYDKALKIYEEIGKEFEALESQTNMIKMKLDRYVEFNGWLKRIPNDVSTLLKGADPAKLLETVKSSDNLESSQNMFEVLGIDEDKVLETVKGKSNSKKRNRFFRYLRELSSYAEENQS